VGTGAASFRRLVSAFHDFSKKLSPVRSGKPTIIANFSGTYRVLSTLFFIQGFEKTFRIVHPVDNFLIKCSIACLFRQLSTEKYLMNQGLPSSAADGASPVSGDGLWQACVDQLAQELPEQQFNTWIKPLIANVADDFSKVVIFVGNRFKLDWIRAQYANRIAGLLQQIHGQPIQVELAITPKETPVRIKPVSFSQELESLPESFVGLEEGIPSGPRTRLNTALTFDTLVEGTANRMARAAAMHVATMPGQLYNPLFIYGGVGLGKTHLMHAVGNKLLSERPDAKVLYIHAEQFVSDVVKAYQRKTFDEFKERYHSLDLLLIDDVQFFANKERTQEEFFNAFEALLAKKSHIIMTSDTYPKGLTDIHERLVSRFDAGLTVAIEPPELEMRVAILISKSRTEGSEMPEEVAFFVAKNVRSNVRELEGALRKILAYSRFNQKEISIQLARDALRDLLSIQNRQISVENIQKTVADYYKIKVADMYSKKRPASIARPRQIAMYLAKELTQKSLPEIGELFGGRDHTTVLHAVRKITAERQQMADLNQQLHVLEQTLKG
jgi:chromosomal replication initiator protein